MPFRNLAGAGGKGRVFPESGLERQKKKIVLI
jgi:hypothetical protein